MTEDQNSTNQSWRRQQL